MANSGLNVRKNMMDDKIFSDQSVIILQLSNKSVPELI